MQFKELGNAFNSFEEMSGARFKGVTSIENMLGYQKKSFNNFLALDSSGISKYTMEQIRAKSAVLGLTDSLTAQAVAKAKDADFTAKVASGTLTYGKALTENKDSILEIGKALEKNELLDDIGRQILLKAKENGVDDYKKEVENIIKMNNGVRNSIINLEASTSKSTGFFDGLKSSFIGFAATIKKMAPSLFAVAAPIIAFKAFDYLQSGWTRAAEAADKATSEFESANSELESLKSQKANQQTRVQEIAAKYDIDTSELQNANGELKSVDQMVAAINSHGGISLVDQAELDNISSASSQLEAQLAIQEQIAEAKKQAMILSTEKAAGTEKTYYEQMKEEHGPLKGFFKWIQGQSHFEVDEYGNEVYKEKSEADKFYGESGDSTDLGLFKTRLAELKEYKSELKSIDSDITESKKNGEEISQSTIDRRNELVDSITNSSSDLAELIGSISADMEILSQSDSDFAVSWVKDAKKALTDFNTIDLSGKDKQLAQTESYFDGSKVSSSIKDSIMQMLQSGEVDSATDALHRMGVTLNDLGITGKGNKAVFDGYFDNLIASAKEAENTVKGIDGSVEGVEAAFATENQDSQWNSMSNLLSQANELYKQGKVGTDDFKAAAQFMSPSLIDPESTKYDSDAYVAVWEAAYDKIQRYFNSADPAQSVQNFTNDLVNAGLADNIDLYNIYCQIITIVFSTLSLYHIKIYTARRFYMVFQTFHNGINLGGWPSQYEYIALKPLTNENLKAHFDSFITEKDIRQISTWGFNHVRLPVSSYLLYDQISHKLKEQPFAYIRESIGWRRAYHLNMILDLHDFWGNVYGAMDTPMPLLMKPSLQEDFLTLWAALSGQLKEYGKGIDKDNHNGNGFVIC